MAKEEMKTTEERKKKATTIGGAVVPSLAGLATTLGTAIPGLRREKPNTTASEAAQLAGRNAAAQVQGAAGAGFGASRGLAARTGMRQATEQTRAAAQVAGNIGLREQAEYDTRRIVRNQRLANFGRDLGDMAAQTSAGVVDARQARDAELEQKGEIMEPMGAEMPMTQMQAPGDLSYDFDPTNLPLDYTPGNQPLGQELEQAQQAANAPPVEPQSQYIPSAPQDPYGALRVEGTPDRAAVENLEAEALLRQEEFILQEAERLNIPPTYARARINRHLGPALNKPGIREPWGY